MGLTGLGSQNANTSRLKMVTTLPANAYDYYGAASNDVTGTEWLGGEMVLFRDGDSNRRIFVQLNTSGVTAKWRQFDTILASSTSTSTSTSTTTSTTTSTSTSTSSSTSTSTSTSSTTTSGE